jgi:hypothetical protein
MQDETFKIRRYTKSGLACLYHPEVSREWAVKKFRHELKKNPKLRYMVDRTIHELTKLQVQQVVDELGEP